jgi:TolB-like protein/tRNA A-37 threonylcarbamoyl transferase component Bud32/tetratricopeptide (TPR) repeat protein
MNGLPRPGERFAHYRIVEQLGKGGMGEVYRAHDEHLHRDVAIKVLPPESLDDPGARARLVREARAAAALSHPYICTVHEVGEADGRAYIAMELVDGQTLSERLESGALPAEQAVRYGIQLAEALGHAHDRGVLHRDLKSANVIVTPAGRVKVLDFGLAKRLNVSDHTTHIDATVGQGTVAGTLAYMAPEQLRGQTAQVASDVWALGVVLYEMAHGTRPFKGQTTFEVTAAILGGKGEPPASSVPAGLRAVIAKCLEQEPGQRYKTGHEVCAALETLQTKGDSAAVPVEAGPTLPVPVAQRTPMRSYQISRRAVLAIGAVVVAVAASVTGWILWRPAVPQRSLAVLPIFNVSGDEALDHLCAGVTEGLIRQIREIPSLRVMSLRRVLQYKSQGVDPRVIGRELTVENILTGTLTRDGQQLTIDAAVIETATGNKLWSRTYKRTMADLLTLQDEIVSAIIDEGLRVGLTASERRRLIRHPTTSAEAYDLYMQARHLQRRGTEDDYLRSKELLERAISYDGQFSLAYAALSAIYAMLVTDGLMRPILAWAEVDRYLAKAVAIDPDFPDALGYAHARAFLFTWDWEAAELARKEVLRTKSHSFDPDDLRAIAIERWALGHPEEALELVKRTRQMDPLNPEMASVEADYLVHTGRLDEAIALYKESIKMEAANAAPYFGVAEAYRQQRRFDDAIDYRRQAHAIAGDDPIAEAFAKAKGEEGYRQADRQWVLYQIEALKERAKTKYASPLDFARAYAQLGDNDRTFAHLKEAFDERSPALVFLNVDQAWDNVRSDPRFLQAVKQVGLPEPRVKAPGKLP